MREGERECVFCGRMFVPHHGEDTEDCGVCGLDDDEVRRLAVAYLDMEREHRDRSEGR